MTAQLTHKGIQAKTTQPAASARTGRVRSAWHQVRRSVAEMNYAGRRLVEVQAPWTIDEQWHTR
jgi:hypothetical protein